MLTQVAALRESMMKHGEVAAGKEQMHLVVAHGVVATHAPGWPIGAARRAHPTAAAIVSRDLSAGLHGRAAALSRSTARHERSDRRAEPAGESHRAGAARGAAYGISGRMRRIAIRTRSAK